MNELSTKIKAELTRLGADLVGFGDLTELPPNVREDLPVGISVGIRVPTDIVRGIAEAPTLEYWDYYHSGQDDLDKLAEAGAEYVRSLGYVAVAHTRQSGTVKFVGALRSALPYKTVATRAGLGWIGKCGMLATEEFGTAVWFSAILTDAPLDCAEPINESKCGECMLCRDACHAGAISGKLWNLGVDRDEFFDATKCASVTKTRANELIGVDYPLCGKCIAVCPRTLRALGGEGANHAI
ncbi:iron-sulfur cluster-binding protein [Clostridia bacterium]|nr:iron-sulfur cluster-binding protein [Clostridia bacterium]